MLALKHESIKIQTDLKKLSAFLIVFLLALASTTYLYYTHWRSGQQAGEAMPYIPQSAALVYEVADFNKQWEHLQQTLIAQELSQLPAFVAIQQAISLLKDLLENTQSLEGVPLTLSVHGLGEEQLGYIFYFNTHDTATQTLLGAIMTKIRQDKAYSKAVRKYAGYKITALSKQGAAKHLSYIKHDQYIIASFSSLLIEDVVRELTSKRQARFLGLKKSANTQGSLYVNFGQLPQLLRTLVKHGQADRLSTSLATFAQASQLNVKLTHHHLLLSGFAKAQESNVQYLTNVWAGQTAGTMLLAPYLPQNTAILQHVTFSDAEQLLAAWQQYSAQSQAGTPEEAATDLLTATLYPLLQGEVGHCTLAASQHHKEGQLVFIKVTDPHTFTEALKGAHLLTVLASRRPGLPANTYQLKTDYFQHWLPGQLFPAFEANYLTQVADYIVLANSQGALETWYAQCQQGKTWANTPTKNAWLASTLDQAQLSLLVDLQKAWSPIMRSLKPAWQQVCETHADALQKFLHGSLQLLHEQDAGCYMSILCKHQEEYQPQTGQTQQATTIHEEAPPKTLPIFFQAEAPIIHAPWLVKSHQNKGYYVLLQDALHQLYLLAPDGKLLWKKTLEGPITTDVFEVDFYKNNKTQYLLATDRQLYLLDYYGRKVSRYPHPLSQPVRLQVVDYSHNKHYRFLMATAQGDIYLKDKQYRPLPAWNPRALGHDFAGTPFHIRVQGKDYFLALQTNGTLQALNRKGQSYPGFPVELKAAVHNPLLVRKGKTAADTALIVLTDTGQHICLNLAGQVQETVQLERSEGSARFMVCPNHASGDQYAIVRQEADKVVVMDEAMNLLFELPYQAQRLLLQYFDFRGGQQCYVLTNPDKQLTYLYDHTGKQLQAIPWQSGHEVSLIFSKEKHQLEVYSGAATQCLKYLMPFNEATP